MSVALFAITLAASPTPPSASSVPRIVLPRDVLYDGIVVYHERPLRIAPVSAPITERIDEPPVEMARVTDGLVSGTVSANVTDQRGAEHAWAEASRNFSKAISPVPARK